MNIEKLSIPNKVLEELLSCIDRFQINTPYRLAHFLAQCSHESGNFQRVEENLNYSADALVKLFPIHFTKQEAELIYARNPEKIANRLYANRMGNGHELSGNGWKFRGRGYIQLTGADNYHELSMTVDDPDVFLNPSVVAEKYPLLSAGWFWSSRHLNAIADGGTDHTIIAAITKKINGGTIGLEDRINQFQKFYKELS